MRPFAHSGALEGVLVGAGVIYTQQKDQHSADPTGRVDATAHLQGFFAQYLLAKQLFVKAVVLAYARSDFDQSFVTGPGAVFSDVSLF